MTTVQKIVRNLFSLAVAEAVNKFIAFLVFTYLARVLGSGGFGRLTFAQAITAYFGLLVELGLNTVGSREIAKNKDNIQRYLDNIISIRLLASILSFSLFCLFIYFINKDLQTKQLLFFMGLSIFLLSFNLDWFFQGLEKMHFIAITNTIKQVLYLCLVVTLVDESGHLVRVGMFHTISYAVAFSISFLIVVRWRGWPHIRIDLPVWKEILTQALPIGFSMVMITFYYNFDTVMLSFMKSDEIVGWYNAAYKIVLTLAVPATILFTGFLPSLSRTRESNNLEKVANNFSRTLLFLGIPIGFGGALLAPQIIDLVFGQEYRNSVLPLQILVWNVVLVYINVSYGHPLMAWGKQNQYTRCVTGGAVTNLFFNVLLIPPFDMVGAAIATILGELAVFIGVYSEYQKTLSMPFFRYARLPILASLGMTGVLLGAAQAIGNVFILSAIGIGVYSLILYFSGGFRPIRFPAAGG